MSWLLGKPDARTLIGYGEAAAALGRRNSMGTRHDEVDPSAITGTVGGRSDFDAQFAARNPRTRRRVDRLADSVASDWPAVELIQLGELYFVVDGHHRVAAARLRGWDTLPARVHRICTIAYAMCCLHAEHLASKAAEQRFLLRVPLADEVRSRLWLDRPEDWPRLIDAAVRWNAERGSELCGVDLAERWWAEEVLPVVDALRARNIGLSLREIEVYAKALRARDRLGISDWPDLVGHQRGTSVSE